MYFLYGESVIYYFKHILLVDRILLPLATHHRFISFMLYIIGESRLHSTLTATDFFQASSSSSSRCRRVTTSSSSPSSPGPTWRSS
jgi:hypothetical protein